ncbi:MAG TPA: patatin-like phospholipase family protein [Candidatus Eisenbacteria bacterium]|nr:patatin-like phospholipase family protein [Candidatus Eisenbacteria bacterium]
MRRLLALLFATITAVPLAAPRLASSQEASAGPPRDQALVLSGGGSRGIAHAGVIAGLEQKGYSPGIVVGTSMGAVIGALYASGLSADSVTSIVEEQDWRQIFAPYPSAVGLDRSVHYPVLRLQGPGGSPQVRGYVDDWQINRQLVRQLFRPSAAVRGDFDRLPRRFRSIAADLRDGELVSIGHGDLARSVRASMAQAGVFSPTTWGNRVLTDGGVSDYFPVAEARRLGAHEVIGVDVLRPTPEITSTEALAVVDRSLRILVQHARADTLPPDILIAPDIDPSLSPLDYPTDPEPLLRAGYQATHSLSEQGSPEMPPALPALPDSLAEVRVLAANSPLQPLLKDAFDRFGKARFDADQILKYVDRLYATGLFTGVWPSVEADRAETPEERASMKAPPAQAAPPVRETAEGDGFDGVGADSTDEGGAPPDTLFPPSSASAPPDSTSLQALGASPDTSSAPVPVSDAVPALIVRAETVGSLSVNGAVGYDNDRGGRAWGNLRRLDVLGSHTVDLALEAMANGIEQSAGVTIRVPTVARMPTAWSGGFYIAESGIRFLNVRPDGDDPEVKRGGGWIGAELRKISPALEATAIFTAEGLDANVGPSGDSFGPMVRIGFIPDNLQLVGIPTSAEGEARTGDARYARVRARGSRVFAFKKLTVAPLFDVAAVTQGAPRDIVPSPGMDQLVPALRWGERRGRAQAIAGVDAAFPLFTKIRLKLRGGGSADQLLPDGSDFSNATLWFGGASVSALWWTPFGRIEGGLEANTLGDRRAVVSVGQDF